MDSTREQVFNSDQEAYMRDLARLPPEEKCDCGWSKRGECYGFCYRNAARGGVVPCDSADPRSRTPCTRPVGHSGDHAGLVRVGAGGHSHHWPREVSHV